jgi:hypothetical protein
MNEHTIPATPSDWIHFSPIKIQAGYRPRCIVLHSAHAGSPHPYVVHRAYVVDGKWAYEQGTYCLTVEEGEKAFSDRCLHA